MLTLYFDTRTLHPPIKGHAVGKLKLYISCLITCPETSWAYLSFSLRSTMISPSHLLIEAFMHLLCTCMNYVNLPSCIFSTMEATLIPNLFIPNLISSISTSSFLLLSSFGHECSWLDNCPIQHSRSNHCHFVELTF